VGFRLPLAVALILFAFSLAEWSALASSGAVQGLLQVVGVPGAALYDPVRTSAIQSRADVGHAPAAFGLLVVARLSPLWVVGLGALGAI
jgi:chromate transporter